MWLLDCILGYKALGKTVRASIGQAHKDELWTNAKVGTASIKCSLHGFAWESTLWIVPDDLRQRLILGQSHAHLLQRVKQLVQECLQQSQPHPIVSGLAQH